MSLKRFYEDSASYSKYATTLGDPKNIRLKINSNENLFLPEGTVREALIEAAEDFDPRIYPIKEELTLKDAIAEMIDIDPASIVIESGGDRVIDLAISSLLKEGDRIFAIEPTFSMYLKTAEIRRMDYGCYLLDPNFDFNPSKLLEASEGAKMVIFCNPNNPTGNQFKKEKVEETIEGFNGPVLIDEAYVEYSDYSLAKRAAEGENLMVLRTFSKAFGLAGLRIGYLVTSPKIAKVLNELYRQPYPVSGFAARVAVNMIRREKMVNEAVKNTQLEREKTLTKLNTFNKLKAFPSSTNFILFDSQMDYQELYHRLLYAGILVRKIGKVPGHNNCLRATVAPHEKMNIFFNALEEALK